MRRWLPGWAFGYQRRWLGADLLAGLVVATLLIPQSLAYAMLAGLPPHLGLYASIVPLLAYAAFGSSMTLSVGPVAVISLMTAAALAPLAAAGSPEYVALAATLALLTGAMLAAAGLLRLGFVADLLSHSVVSGFISGSAVLIIVGQLRPLVGISAAGDTAVELLLALIASFPDAKPATALLGIAALLLLWLARRHMAPALRRLGLADSAADLLARLAPMAIVIGAAAGVAALALDARYAIAVVGPIPQGLPALALPLPQPAQLQTLLLPAAMIALVGFVESVSVARSLAARRREPLDADAELRGLGAANIASAVAGGFPVAGGFSRSVVNFSAGARTPFAGIVAAGAMALVLLGLTGAFESLPIAVLSATIIIAVAPLIDVRTFVRTWRYDRADALALAATFAGVLALGVEAGIAAGVGASLATLVWRTHRPHIAVVGRVPGTQHFRNVARQRVDTQPRLLALRIDENLLFTNARPIEQRILQHVDAESDVADVVLVMSSVNRVDASGAEMLAELAHALRERGLRLHLAEIKGPLADRLARSETLAPLARSAFLSTHLAFEALSGGTGR